MLVQIILFYFSFLTERVVEYFIQSIESFKPLRPTGAKKYTYKVLSEVY
jgi:hypothetical protein